MRRMFLGFGCCNQTFTVKSKIVDPRIRRANLSAQPISLDIMVAVNKIVQCMALFRSIIQ